MKFDLLFYPFTTYWTFFVEILWCFVKKVKKFSCRLKMLFCGSEIIVTVVTDRHAGKRKSPSCKKNRKDLSVAWSEKIKKHCMSIRQTFSLLLVFIRCLGSLGCKCATPLRLLTIKYKYIKFYMCIYTILSGCAFKNGYSYPVTY